MTHDYTNKGGIIHTEIMLPAHAPPEFQDRSSLWNSVEQIEKSSDAQLAREIEVALPVELSPAQQLALVRSFVKNKRLKAQIAANVDRQEFLNVLFSAKPLLRMFLRR